MAKKIHFKPLDESHFSLIHQWFNKPHIQAFYSLREWALDEVHQKLVPYLRGEKQIKSFIIYLEDKSIGYIQSYPVKEHPWENQELPEAIVNEAAGFDLFIGEEDCLQKGYGTQIVKKFLDAHVWPVYQYCISDSDVRNEASLLLFKKCGFKEHKKIETINALKQKVTLQFFIKNKDS